MEGFPGNRTLDILSKAEHEGYGVLAQVWYFIFGFCCSLVVDTNEALATAMMLEW